MHEERFQHAGLASVVESRQDVDNKPEVLELDGVVSTESIDTKRSVHAVEHCTPGRASTIRCAAGPIASPDRGRDKVSVYRQAELRGRRNRPAGARADRARTHASDRVRRRYGSCQSRTHRHDAHAVAVRLPEPDIAMTPGARHVRGHRTSSPVSSRDRMSRSTSSTSSFRHAVDESRSSTLFDRAVDIGHHLGCEVLHRQTAGRRRPRRIRRGPGTATATGGDPSCGAARTSLEPRPTRPRRAPQIHSRRDSSRPSPTADRAAPSRPNDPHEVLRPLAQLLPLVLRRRRQPLPVFISRCHHAPRPSVERRTGTHDGVRDTGAHTDRRDEQRDSSASDQLIAALRNPEHRRMVAVRGGRRRAALSTRSA